MANGLWDPVLSLSACVRPRPFHFPPDEENVDASPAEEHLEMVNLHLKLTMGNRK